MKQRRREGEREGGREEGGREEGGRKEGRKEGREGGSDVMQVRGSSVLAGNVNT